MAPENKGINLKGITSDNPTSMFVQKAKQQFQHNTSNPETS